MSAKMTRERAEEFGVAWNSGDADLIASFFAEDGVYHASVGPMHLARAIFAKSKFVAVFKLSSSDFPEANSKN